MHRMIGLGAFTVLLAGTAHAEVSALKVPALCGPSVEILDALAHKMPDPQVIGTGGDSNGEEVATLFAGNGYWALIAMVSPERVCVVASGHDWKVGETGVSNSF